MNGLNKKLKLKLSSIGLTLCVSLACHWQCAYQQVAPVGSLPYPLAQRQAIWKTMMPIEGEGRLSYEQGQSAVTLPFKFQFNSVDSLWLQLFDPLGRQQAHIALVGSEYEIQLLREKRTLSGREWPAWIQEYLPLSLTPTDLRWVLLGSSYPQTSYSSSVRYRLGNYKHGVKRLLVPGQMVLTYRRFQACGPIALAKEIAVALPSYQSEVLIEVTDFRWSELKLSSK